MTADSFFTSKYNFAVPVSDGIAIFNANTGALINLQGADSQQITSKLAGPPAKVELEDFGSETFNFLRRNGFIVGSENDELLDIQARYWHAREITPLVLTLTTTMDCNLGCYYCYESRSKKKLAILDIAPILGLLEERFSDGKQKTLHVDWYGGEPLMNVEFMEHASIAIQKFANSKGVKYSASVISNGTLWPEDIEDFVRRHQIRQVQISFDGCAENHNRTRFYRNGYQDADQLDSYTSARKLIDRLVQVVRVDVRFNISPKNQNDLIPFIQQATDSGWFSAPFKCVFQLAKVSAYTERSAFVKEMCLSDEEYSALQEIVRKIVDKQNLVEPDLPGNILQPKSSVCAALASKSVVIGAEGLEYRCGLQVGDIKHAVASIHEDLSTFADKEWWDKFDPTTIDSCSKCSFLPVCWGGCAKRHLDDDKEALHAISLSWRRNLPRMIAARAGKEMDPSYCFKESDQFRI